MTSKSLNSFHVTGENVIMVETELVRLGVKMRKCCFYDYCAVVCDSMKNVHNQVRAHVAFALYIWIHKNRISFLYGANNLP